MTTSHPAARLLARPLPFGLAVGAWVAVALALDRRAGHGSQLLLGGATWVLLLGACAPLDRGKRARVAAVVAVATLGEVLGSIVLGLYTYRLHNLPSFVPPGHGLIYLVGLRFAAAPLVRANLRSVVRVALAAGGLWAVLGLVAGGRPDVLGALTMACLAFFLLRGRVPALYAGVFLAVALLELYGTGIGAWRWAEQAPQLGFGIGNPPSGIAAGYCLFDAAALRLGPGLERLATAARSRPAAPARA